MEGRPPFEDDELDFDFESSRRRSYERETGERPVEPPPEEAPARAPGAPGPPEESPFDAEEPAHTAGGAARDTGASPFDTGERPYDTGERPYDTGERPYDTGERPYDTGERPYDTGERPYETTGERAYETTGEGRYDPDVDPFDTGERRARRRERPKRRRLRLGGRRRGRPERSADSGERALRDDPYTPAEVAVAGSRRSRHRDLPAKVRRRQAMLVGGVVLLLVVGLFLLARVVLGGGDSDEEQPLGLKKLVGQTIIAKLGKADPDRELLRRVRKGQVGGVIATAPRDEQTLSRQVSQLQQAADEGGNPPLLIMIDQEGGEVVRLDGPPNQSPQEIGEAGADAARSEGEDTGNFLKGVGVNVDLAPVLDVAQPETADSIAERTFGDDPALVSEVGSAFIEGMQSTGVAATAKHFPGLGPATLSTDDAPVTIAAGRETLDEALQPFQAAVDSGVELVMVGSAIYPDYGPENPRDPNRPASSVKAINQGLLRDKLGFQGLIITDDLQSVAVETLTTSSTAGIAALGAGADLLLYAGSNRGSEEGFAAVVRATKRKKLSRQSLQASYDRITGLKSRLAAAASG